MEFEYYYFTYIAGAPLFQYMLCNPAPRMAARVLKEVRGVTANRPPPARVRRARPLIQIRVLRTCKKYRIPGT